MNQSIGRLENRFAMVDLCLVTVACLAASLPFLDKPFHIDDVLYLRGAEQIQKGLGPYDGLVLWDAADGQPAPLFKTDYNPPLWKFLLASVIKYLAPDRAEWKLHLLSAGLTLMAGYGLYFAGKRLTRHAVWCAAFVVLGPFYMPGQNLMAEPLLLATWSWALFFLFKGFETERWHWMFLAGLAASLAFLTKYTGGLFLPVALWAAICFGFSHRQTGGWRTHWRVLFALLPPVLTVMAWNIYTTRIYGEPHLGSHGVSFGFHEVETRILAVLRSIGSVMVLSPYLFLAGWRPGGWRRLMVVVALLLASAVGWFDLRQVLAAAANENWSPSALQQLHYVLFTANGAFSLLMIGLLAFRSDRPWHVDVFLVGWMALLLLFNVLSTPFLAIRHLLLFFVPYVWYSAGAVQARRSALAASVLLAVALAAADFEFAETYRSLANNELRRELHAARANGNTVWFTGNWGWVYYASQGADGLHAFPVLLRPADYGLPEYRPDDVIVKPELLTWISLPSGLRYKIEKHLQPAGGRWVGEFLKPDPASSSLYRARTILGFISQFFRTVAPQVHYYAVIRHSLPWEILIDKPDASVKSAIYELPPMDDILILRLVSPEAGDQREPQ